MVHVHVHLRGGGKLGKFSHSCHTKSKMYIYILMVYSYTPPRFLGMWWMEMAKVPRQCLEYSILICITAALQVKGTANISIVIPWKMLP